jgi:hypothetical protein
MTETRSMPPLGGGSIDFNAVHDADAKGAELTGAIEKAAIPVEGPAEAPKAHEAPDAGTTPKPTAPKPAKPAASD